MPMLGKYLFQLVKPLQNVGEDENIYTIAHTNEQFRSKAEYLNRSELYKHNIWTCRCTGGSKMVLHEDALKSEDSILKKLKSQFQECFEKSVLRLVHHSTDSLGTLVDLAWLNIVQMLSAGETVTFRISDKLRGVVSSITPVECCEVLLAKCNSQSGGKENSNDQSSATLTCPQLLPFKYSVQLDDGLLVNAIPAQDLIRSVPPPDKDLVRLFIRAYAVRAVSNPASPWVVDDVMVMKHALSSRLCDLSISPITMVEAAKQAEVLIKKHKCHFENEGLSKKFNSIDDAAIKNDNDRSVTRKLKPGVNARKLKQQTIKDLNILLTKEQSIKPQVEQNAVHNVDCDETSEKAIEIDSSDEDIALSVLRRRNMFSGNHDSDSDIPLCDLRRHEFFGTTAYESMMAERGQNDGIVNSASICLHAGGKLKQKGRQLSKSRQPTVKFRKRLSSELKNREFSTRMDSWCGFRNGVASLCPTSPAKTFSSETDVVELPENDVISRTADLDKSSSHSEKDLSECDMVANSVSHRKKTASAEPLNGELLERHKSMKQTTLIGIATKKRGPVGRLVFPVQKKTPGRPQTPLIVKRSLGNQRLPKASSHSTSASNTDDFVVIQGRQAYDWLSILQHARLITLDNGTDRQKFRMMLKRSIHLLTPSERSNLPLSIREKMHRMVALIEEKQALERMTECEREMFLKDKKDKQKYRIKEKKRKRQKEMRKRYEERDLDLKPLPAPKLVQTPEGIPNELFGSIVMVTEFISSFSSLFMFADNQPLCTESLMKALADGERGFSYLSPVLVVLLQTLLQDEIMAGCFEFKMALSEIDVNSFTASELVRLSLRDMADGEIMHGRCDANLTAGLIRRLESCDFFQLDPRDKIELLLALCQLVMETYSLIDFMEKKQQEANRLSRQRILELKGNVKIPSGRQAHSNEVVNTSSAVNTANDVDTTRTVSSASDNVPGIGDQVISLASFYGRNSGTNASNTTVDDEETITDGDDLVSVLRRRRRMVEKVAQEKEQRDFEKRFWREKECEDEKKRRQQESFEIKVKDSIQLARTVMRHTPIGCDRHHSRYWLFGLTTPGLFVEEGWMSEAFVSDCINTSLSQAKGVTCLPSARALGAPATQHMSGHRKTPVVVANSDRNLWFTYDSVEDLDALLVSLHRQGVHEARLKREIKYRYQGIAKMIQDNHRNEEQPSPSDGLETMESAFKQGLCSVEMRLRNGGLGGVADYDMWEGVLLNTSDLTVLSKCLLEIQENIPDRFLQKFMKQERNDLISTHRKEAVCCDNVTGINHDNDGGNDWSVTDKEVSSARRDLLGWRDAVASCCTLSRLHVLLSMMNVCIKWDKSAENAKCKICRKKDDDHRMLLCDDCNQAYHIYCLRPPLLQVPVADWFCAICLPRNQPNIHSPAEDEYQSETETEDSPRRFCQVCREEDAGSDCEPVVVCHTCKCPFHLHCHQPRLRHMPRGLWQCSGCKGDALLRTFRSRKRKRNMYKDGRRTSSSDDDTDVSEDDDTTPVRSKRLSQLLISRFTRCSGDAISSVEPRSRVSRPCRPLSDLTVCGNILRQVMQDSSSWPFLIPVDKKEVPDYYSVIKKPMDFLTMQKKCSRLGYSSTQQFVDDAALVFSNAAQYNECSSDVYICMRKVERLFFQLLSKHLPDFVS